MITRCPTINFASGDRSLQQHSTSTATDTMKVKIKKWNAVATWRWDIPEDDVCGICQVHFDGTCPACKYPGDDCSLCKFGILDWWLWTSRIADSSTVSGKCGHNFHMHCILEWIKQDSAKGQCPMCRQKFEWVDQQNEDAEGQSAPDQDSA
ncbi:RING-H2 zinc finger-domain-containing protein [Lasiosphaeria hispida]|uniref:Anaphase-promoting complex subunit 11 n=1 Tax=Lasiosphaeria hispida TaxID=260671 RepID=A0AAJ0MAI2_9PEZI|nr:RING-H2 zinc finger-domain-containing protein [Lasiosphaeria hispida]